MKQLGCSFQDRSQAWIISVQGQAALTACLKHWPDGVSKSHRIKPPMCLVDSLGCGEGDDDDGRIVYLIQG